MSQIQVAFDSSGSANIDGQVFKYTVAPPNVLNLQDQFGSQDSYQYQFTQNNLTLTYSDGSSFVCQKNKGGPLNRASGSTGSVTMATPAQGGGNEWQLQGSFCNWSGSSSSYSGSSYSSTRRVNYDGRGRWSFGAESSFSNNAGFGYGGGGTDNSGSYRIQGNAIYYTTDAGEQGVAQVNMQQNDGRITEIKIDGALYAPQLCD